MIQVCSTCGTRWDVRDQRRAWCPRCNGALWAPLTREQEADLHRSPPRSAPPPVAGPGLRPEQGPPAGYRWIAVRPGAPPPPRRRRRALGPTPRYTSIPRWTLMDRVAPPTAPEKPAGPGPSAHAVQRRLVTTMGVLAVAALMQAVVYLLLIINRSTLLHPAVAAVALWLSRLTSLAAILAVISCAVLLTRWLTARRSAAFASAGLPETRSRSALWAGCLVPLVNLVWAPVYVVELAGREGRLARLRKPILAWWLVWVFATAVSLFATANSGASDAQGIANNTVTFLLAYLAGVAAVAATARVFESFERRAVDRPAHHWVVVAEERGDLPAPVTSGAAPDPELESDGREPAA
ncbi:MAG TPA: DUF4328 domain-containing protein [Mycobacterium sp.]|nr:DUF4328 domain-containing protein [Mycobacterium sp.]